MPLLSLHYILWRCKIVDRGEYLPQFIYLDMLNQVWRTDITDIRLASGVVAGLNGSARHVLAGLRRFAGPGRRYPLPPAGDPIAWTSGT